MSRAIRMAIVAMLTLVLAVVAGALLAFESQSGHGRMQAPSIAWADEGDSGTGESDDPSQSGDPADSADPADPSDPTDPPGPSDPSDPAEPSSPSNPSDQPDQPDQPGPASDSQARMEKAKQLIMALPRNSYDITAAHADAVRAAQDAYNALTPDERSHLDATMPEDGSRVQTYGRCLELAQWALESLSPIDNSTALADGTYTGVVSSDSSMGKSESVRGLKFKVVSIAVSGGRATALIEHGGTAPDRLKVGGVEYGNLNPDGNSRFEIPINLNETMYFLVMAKGATESTDAIAYEFTSSVDEASARPDAAAASDGSQGTPDASQGENGAGSRRSSNRADRDGVSASSRRNSMALAAAVANRNARSDAKKADRAARSAEEGEASEADVQGRRIGLGVAEAYATTGDLPAAESGAASGSGESVPLAALLTIVSAIVGIVSFLIRFRIRERAPAKRGLAW